jgi:hypothetical protein
VNSYEFRKKSVAIIFNGHLRTLNHTYPYLKKFLLNKIQDRKIYICTWDKKDNTHATWWRKSIGNVQKTNPQELIKLFKPNYLKIRKEKSEGFKKTPQDKFHNFPTYGLYQSLTGTVHCLQEAEKDPRNYRFIVVRPDLRLFSPILLKEINDTKYMYFPRMDYFTSKGSVCDVWYIISREHIKIFVRYLERIKKIVYLSSRRVTHHEEIFHDKVLKRFNPKIKLSRTKWGLQRDKESITVWPSKESLYRGDEIKLQCKKFFDQYLNLNNIFKISFSDNKAILTLGSDIRISSKKNVSTKKKVAQKARFSCFFVKKMLPRFSAGKNFLKISFPIKKYKTT